MQTARKTATHSVDTVRHQPQTAHDTGRRRRVSVADVEDVNNNADAVDYSAATVGQYEDDGDDDDDVSSTVPSLVDSKCSGGRRRGWSVKATSFAHNTINPIRRIIEQLQIEPNPEKFMIPLSIGEFFLYCQKRDAHIWCLWKYSGQISYICLLE